MTYRAFSKRVLVCAIVVLASMPGAVFADAWTTGDANADPLVWTTATDAYIGYDDLGCLYVDGGSDIASQQGFIAFRSTASGWALEGSRYGQISKKPTGIRKLGVSV